MVSADISIVPMAESHLDALAALEQACFSQPWSREGLAAELTNPQAIFRVAVAQGQVLGYVGMHHIVDEGYITNVAVFEQYRGLGVARRLLQELMEYGQKHRLALITLEVRPSNTPAVGLYRSLGFAEVGRRKNFYQNPAEDGLMLTLYFE